MVGCDNRGFAASQDPMPDYGQGAEFRGMLLGVNSIDIRR